MGAVIQAQDIVLPVRGGPCPEPVLPLTGKENTGGTARTIAPLAMVFLFAARKREERPMTRTTTPTTPPCALGVAWWRAGDDTPDGAARCATGDGRR